jgi:hypothetical protein
VKIVSITKYGLTKSIFLAIVILLLCLSFISCDDADSLIPDTPINLNPISYDGPVAESNDDEDDWEWQIEPKLPYAKYKYEWEIWSISADGARNIVKEWESERGDMVYPFLKAGEYRISVEIFDKSTNDSIGEAEAKVITRKLSLTASETSIKPGQEVIFTLKSENPPKDPVMFLRKEIKSST